MAFVPNALMHTVNANVTLGIIALVFLPWYTGLLFPDDSLPVEDTPAWAKDVV